MEVIEKSSELNELFSALAKAQSEMRVAGKDSNNPFFKSKYADLASVVAASRPHLAKNGLSVIQQITIDNNDGKRLLVTILGHSSGQYISSRVGLNPIKEDMQSLGSAITYMRRYAYASLVGVVADDEDDDGEVAMRPSRSHLPAPTSYTQKQAPTEKISIDQHDILQKAFESRPDLAESLLSRGGYTSLADIPRDKFQSIHERLIELKAL